MRRFVSKKVNSLSTISTTSLLSQIAISCLLGSLLVGFQSINFKAKAANPTVTELSIPSSVVSANDVAVSSDGSKLVLLSASVNRRPNANRI